MDDDEILLYMAEQLGQMVPSLIPADSASTIIDILEQLCGVEETVVRAKAVESINSVVKHLDSDQVTNLTEMVKRLSGADWFTSKVSVCGILASIYSKATTDDVKAELRQLYKQLVEDDTPMVRRSAATNLGDFTAVCDKDAVLADIIPLFNKLVSDEQDSVRLLAVMAAKEIGAVLKDETDNLNNIFPTIRNACNDRSWRVRHNIAKTFFDLASALNFQGDNLRDLIECFVNLMNDTEAEVRSASCAGLAQVAGLAGEELFLDTMIEKLAPLAEDGVCDVREKIATSIMVVLDTDSVNKLSETVIIEKIVPLLTKFLEDEHPEVQLNVLRKLPIIAHLLPKCDKIVDCVSKMSEDSNWRIRETVGQILPYFAEAFGVSTFESNYLKTWQALLSDQVCEVRLSIVQGVGKLSATVGAPWIQKKIIPLCTKIYDETTSYLVRITMLKLYFSLCPDESVQPQLLEELMGLVLKALKDKVPNVRMVAARGLTKLSSFCDDIIIQNQIKPALTDVTSSDDDGDVKFYAQDALLVCN